MATKDPVGNQGLTVNFLPKLYQTPANRKFLQSTLDQLFQPGSVNKVTGFIGRPNARAATGSDIYISSTSKTRGHYQLEPGAVIKDELGNVTFFKDYQDYINQLGVLGANTTNHARLNKQEMYSWDPHIDWDKFTNFQNYYWVPYGPDPISIAGQTDVIESGYTVNVFNNGNSNEYIFTPDGLTPNPTLKLYRGQTYTFDINSPGDPFTIRTARSLIRADEFAVGITNNHTTSGTVTLVLDKNSPSILYYQSANDLNLGGTIEIFDIDQATHIDVANDLLGKKSYTLKDGTKLSNGMLVHFIGNVTPSQYAKDQYYVEGVGTAIKLIPKTILEVVSPYTTSEAVLFDDSPFDKLPFSDATGYATEQDYIVINRASRDYNPWSRYNRWFHKDVLEASAAYNNAPVSLDQTLRATRPIIEFQADLKLFNFGTDASYDVDLIDNFTTDVFSTIEGAGGYSVDGISLSLGQVILFTADLDPMVKNKLYRVEFVDVLHLNSGSNQIHLVELAEPVLNQSILIKQGLANQSLMYWYNGTDWIKSQQKINANQPPLFDLFDENEISYSNLEYYPGSTFSGTKIFSYKIGIGVKDAVLGFPLSYQNVNNIGDIVFNFNLESDTFEYKQSKGFVTVNVSTGYLATKTYGNSIIYVNGWQICTNTNVQAAVRNYKNSKRTTTFPIDIFDNVDNLDDLVVFVYVNDILIPLTDYTITTSSVYKSVVLKTAIASTDILTIRAFASQPINANGFYEIPVNLQNNPLNGMMLDFTLGEVSDHIRSIIPYLSSFSGVFPGSNNLRDLGNITQYGVKFVQHSGPASLSTYHITNEANNVIRAIEQAQEDYNNFKREFVTVASNLGIDTDVSTMIELVMTKITNDKPDTAPYYFSDMVPFGGATKTTLKVIDYRIKTYPLSAVFNLDTLSNKAVGVYLNGKQLTYKKDYTFNSQAFVVIDAKVNLANKDTITIVEYDSTDGCFVPETPTKMGIWPKYEPKIYLDTTLLVPRMMIQGHDGSQVLAYGDYRDDLILELELRIYNNIKVEYDPTIFDITDIIPGYARTTDYSLTEFNAVLAPTFYRWAKSAGVDFSKQISFDINNPFTYNYNANTAPDGTSVPGYWRGVYRWLLDTDRPDLCPWEMLGFSVEPAWWQSVYGPAPYTSNNLVMWQDIANGRVNEPGKASVQLKKYIRTWLTNSIPVDENGNLKNPSAANIVKGVITPNPDLNFVFGDVGPVEASWRRSSYYPFAILIATVLTKPAVAIGTLFDRSRIVRNIAGQLIYKDTGLRISPSTLVLPSTYSSTTRVSTAGLANYLVNLIFNYIFSNNQKSYTAYQYDLTNITVQLSYRLGAFTNKDQFNLLLESKTPASTGNVFIPAENYSVIINKSSPVKKLIYSGIIITRLQDSYQVSGYSQSQPYFKYFDYKQTGPTINVGGISESFVRWTSNQEYVAGSVVLASGAYYRVTVSHTSSTTFNPQYFAKLSGLPYAGGQTVYSRTAWNTAEAIVVPYGTKLYSVQDVYDFIVGYGEYLKSEGFYFDEFNTNLGTVVNWETSAKEFLFWTTQNWSVNQTKWSEWASEQPYTYATVVKYNGEYYSAKSNLAPTDIFDFAHWQKLDGLSTIGSSIISLSPAARLLKFLAPQSVVDDINNLFNRYEIFKVDGTPIEPNHLDSYRSGNVVSYSPRGNDSIYSASFYFVQNEHVVIIDNSTIFNDVIYNLESGYRRERIKVSGYVTTGWYGGLDIPGFIFDSASIKTWQPWQDYNLGDIVYQHGFYYSANQFLPGTAVFNLADWTALAKQPTSQILPNWTNLATQFGDFYGLDLDSFDPAQQSMGQHLIGYQKRQYLNNIIQDDVSEFKFFQGMIREKGTQNVLNKLFGVLSNDNLDSLTFYEEWAIRVGQYGASDAFEQIEFVLDEGQIKSNPQGFLLTNQHDGSINPFIIQQIPNQVYVKPTGYTSNPWPLLSANKSLLRSAGYVNSGDVFVSLGQLSDLANQDVTTFNNGSYVWCAFDQANTWNVYRFTDIGLRLNSVTFDSKTKTLILQSENIISNLSVGAWVGINQTTSINGFYQVISVVLNTVTLQTSLTSIPVPFTEINKTVVYALISQRASSIDTIDSILTPQLTVREYIWTDDKGDGTWGVWKYNPVYSANTLETSTGSTELNHGRVIAIAKSGKVSVFSSNDGRVNVYAKPGQSLNWSKTQVIQYPEIAAYTSPASAQQYGNTGAIVSLNIGSLGTTANLSTLSGGSGYLPKTGSQTYNNISLIPVAITGNNVTGTGAKANITVTNGTVFNVVIVKVNTQYGNNDQLTANAVDIGGDANSVAFSIKVTDTCGLGYSPLSGSKTYYSVPLIYALGHSGNGSGATANIVVTNGKVVSAQIILPGNNYSVTDVLTASSVNLGGTGSGFTISPLQINPNLPSILSTVLAMSDDATWLAVGSPSTSYAASQLVSAVPNGSISFNAGSICFYNGKYYQTTTALQAQYTGISGTTTSTSTGALFTIQSVVPGVFTPLVVAGGTGYHVGQTILIPGSNVGGEDTINDITLTVATVDVQGSIVSVTGSIKAASYKDRYGNTILVPNRTYVAVSGTLQLGSGAQFTVAPFLTNFVITTTSVGSNYKAGDKILIKGSKIGGVDVINDLTLIFDGTVFSYFSGVATWSLISYVPVSVNGTNFNCDHIVNGYNVPYRMGAVSLYKKDVFDNYVLIDTILSPTVGSLANFTDEQFGSTLTFNGDTLYIGSKGTYSNIYTMRYQNVVHATTDYNPVGSIHNTLVVTSTAGIKSGMYIQGTGFTSGQYVISVVDSVTLTMSGNPNVTPSGTFTFYTTGWSYDYSLSNRINSVLIPGVTTLNGNLSSIVSTIISTDRSTMAISGQYNSLGIVLLFKNTGTGFNLTSPDDIIIPDDATVHFGSYISLSDDGAYLAIGDDYTNTSTTPGADNYEGSVTVYAYDSTADSYLLYQTIVNHSPEADQEFGSKIGFMNNGNTLIIYSKNGTTREETTFDEATTTFDKQSTNFVTKKLNSGRVDVYDRYATKWVFSESLETTDQAGDNYGQGFAVGTNEIMVGAPYYTLNGIQIGQVWTYSKLLGNYTWTIHDKPVAVPDLSKVKKAFLYNKKFGTLVKHLDVIDPNQGKVPGPAEEEIKYKSFVDPAVYGYGTDSVTVDAGSQWASQQVGTLWWNLSTAKFINSYVEDIVYRTTTWNMLAAGASVDIYEWVKSKYKPSQWDVLADTVEGLVQGISGTSLYGDTAYSITSYVDKVSQNTIYTYYFWVKNKAVTPNVNGRNMSASDVSKLIANPRGQDYTYLALTGPNTFSLVNAKSYLKESDIVLSIEYWTSEQTEQNIHSQWKIVSNDPTTILPKTIEQKWIDSLCGVDLAGRSVPDTELPPKLQYGVENRPRQSMFVNRFEALKEFIETTNSILIDNQVAYNSNLTPLNSYDQTPTSASGLWDTELSTDADLAYVNLTSFQMPSVTPIIVDGRITGITIVNPGKGYVRAPYIEVVGSGKGAVIRTTIDVTIDTTTGDITGTGAIIGATVISSGEGYTDATQCLIRNYSVLVNSDSQAENKWSIYSYDVDNNIWSRILTQRYDVTKYWSYADWFDTANGYNQYAAPGFSVDTFAQLNTITVDVGNTVRVNFASNGKWMLLEKYADSTSVDWSQSYSVVGIQDGTIQFSRSLYEFQSTNIGYDNTTFDGGSFDTVASTELRIILNSIKNDLLIGTDALKQSYLDLFFDSIRYAMKEQLYIDWAFKTSFVKAENHIGTLDQPVNYPVDNIGNFEEYIAEVKPYRTKVRQYVNNYTSLDVSQSAATDFDLEPLYENGVITPVNATVNGDTLFVGDAIVQTYPWKFWLDNLGYSVIEIKIVNGGSGYIREPNVVITSASGAGATARAFITNGVVTNVILTNINEYGESGSGYLTAPTVTIDGGLGITGVQARAVAIIGSSKIRTQTTAIKFDRISRTSHIIQLKKTETFTGNGSQLQFNLVWPSEIRLDPTSTVTAVTVDGIPVLRELYTLSVVTNKTDYTKYSGKITFATGYAPKGTIVVNYKININVLNSIDRDNYYYDPTTGMLPNIPNQLMTGIDYGGVIVDGTDFNVSQGWDALPFFSDKWASADTSFDDYIVTVSAGQYDYPVPGVAWPATWTLNTPINIYTTQLLVTSNISDGVSTVYEYNIFAAPVLPKAKVSAYSTDVRTTFVLAGSYGTVIKVSSTVGIVPGMSVYAVSGTGWVLQHLVESIVDATTLNLNTAPDSVPPDGELLTFTFNRAGSRYLNVNDASNIKVGDTVSSSSGLIVVNTHVTAINPVISGIATTNVVEIDDILYRDIATTSILSCVFATTDGTTVTLTLSNSLTSPLAVGQNITVAGFTPAYFNGVFTVTGGDNLTIQYANFSDAPPSGTSGVAGTVVVNNIFFERILSVPADITIYTSGIATLVNPLPRGVALEFVGQLNQIRLDDPNYGDVWTIVATSSSDNSVTTVEPITFPAGNYIVFGGTGFGNLSPDVPYYVFSIIDEYNFTVASSIGDVTIPQVDATGAMLATSYINPYAIIKTPLYTGSSMTVTLPQGVLNPLVIFGNLGAVVTPFVVNTGDTIYFRRNDSDGSLPTPSVNFDTSLSGGSLAHTGGESPKAAPWAGPGIYSTATGIAPDDIIIDGDGFVTETTSPAPEEVVPGQVVDTLAIKVYDRPAAGSSNIRVDNFVGDNVKSEFILTQQPNSPDALIVKVGTTILTSGVDYTFDYRNNSVTLMSVPATGVVVTIFNIGFNGANILDIDHFVGDGTTKEFITKANWLSSITSLIYLDGGIVTPVLFKTDSTYDTAGVVGIRFPDAPAANALINFIIVSGNTQTFSVTHAETFTPNGLTDTFALTYPVGTSLPNESNMIVRVDNTIYTASVASYFTIEENVLNYTIDSERIAVYTAGLDQISVAINGQALRLGVDYSIDLGGITILLSQADTKTYNNQIMAVNISSESQYTYIPTTNSIQFAEGSVPPAGSILEVITSYDHSYLDLERTEITVSGLITTNVGTTSYYEYNAVSGGIITLDRIVINADYVWVIQNKILLTPNIDYVLYDDRKTIKLARNPAAGDKITLITFGNNVLTTGISYMQFKDMLNRTVYKRLSRNKQTILTSDLNYNDSEIYVADASNLDTPSISSLVPGVVEIRGERIEYWIKDGNTLKQLRRGTLGTGIYSVNKAGTVVQGIGISETIPYQDTTVKNESISDGVSQYIELPFVPVKTTTWPTHTGTAIPEGYGQCDSMEVFVGGYDDTAIWQPNTSYSVGTIVHIGSYTYRCTQAHTGGATFFNDVVLLDQSTAAYTDVWQFFVGNIRLKKQPYSVHNINIAPYSPAGDITLDADFAVDGVSSSFYLTNKLTAGTSITVIRRTLSLWDSTTNIHSDTGKIAEFLKSTPGISYTGYKK
jgi:hypothetical protein